MRASDFDILIVPRRGGAMDGDWSSRWRAKLSTARFAVPADPDAKDPGVWRDAIVSAAAAASRPILFVGHGAGAIEIVNAAPLLSAADVRGAFLVAPPDPAGAAWPDGSEIRRRRLLWPSVVVASRNDPDGAFGAISELAADWGAELIDAGPAGRIDEASGHGPWPEGLVRLAGFLRRLGETPIRLH